VPEIPIKRDETLASLVRLGLVCAAPVAVGPNSAGLDAAIRATCSDLMSRHAGESPAEIEGVFPARSLYRAFGIDPTRHRPSSEALLRRVVQGKGLPRILNAVDLCNLFALRFLLPLGLYDADRIQGEVTLRKGTGGESYEGIRKDAVHLEGRPVLADALGPFGNPTSDSLRTCVTPATGALFMVIFAPAAYPGARLAAHVAAALDDIRLHLAPPEAVVEGTASLLPAEAAAGA
jgi:DNA/RNA-binding domain of Phe-tRNA-synthetase-like protein